MNVTRSSKSIDSVMVSFSRLISRINCTDIDTSFMQLLNSLDAEHTEPLHCHGCVLGTPSQPFPITLFFLLELGSQRVIMKGTSTSKLNHVIVTRVTQELAATSSPDSAVTC